MIDLFTGTKRYRTRAGLEVQLTASKPGGYVGYLIKLNRPTGDLLEWNQNGDHVGDPDLDLVERIVPRST